MSAMAEKDWMDDIMFLCRLRGRTMNRDTAISRSTRKLKVTYRGQSQIITQGSSLSFSLFGFLTGREQWRRNTERGWNSLQTC